MKNLFPISLVVLFLAACNNLSNGQSQSLAINDFEKKLNETSNAQLVDVRTPDEYAERHLANAANVNFNSDDFIDKVEKLDKTKPVFVYCLSGGRSKKAAALISKKGFKEVYEMEGGILAWADAKKPLQQVASSGAQANVMEAFLNQVTKDKLVLVDFNATWCGPCKILMPIVEKVEKKNAAVVELLAIDVDQNSELANQMHIKSIPLLVLYKKGKEVWRTLGVVDEATITAEVKKWK